jgi:protein-L-isoaspartate O-methyltransferase
VTSPPISSSLEPGQIQKKLRLLMELRRAGISDARVLGAIEKVPREKFVPASFEDQAYETWPCRSATVRPSANPILWR